MFQLTDKHLKIDTPHTTLLFKVCHKEIQPYYTYEPFESYLMPIHYGRKLQDGEDFDILCKNEAGRFASISCPGNTDVREPLLLIQNADGSYVNDFRFMGIREVGDYESDGMPKAHSVAQLLEIRYVDDRTQTELYQYIGCFQDTDVLTSAFRLVNKGENTITVRRLMSLQSDLVGGDYTAYTFNGDWGHERMRKTHPLSIGVFVNESLNGMSSALTNPFIMLQRSRYDDWYAYNLLFTGNHKESVELNYANKTRVLVGMNDFAFSCELGVGEAFTTPQAVQVYAPSRDDITCEMHKFVNRHILRGMYAREERPVVINNWEATYFDFTVPKIVELAKKAKNIGVELFVLDDGWFSTRNNDTSGLGDWSDNLEKTEGGIQVLAEKIREIGLRFGIWVEPEMVNPNSELYRLHPEWAVTIDGRTPIQLRNQYILDLANPEVVNYLLEQIAGVIERCRADYIKWDCNRFMTEFYSRTLKNQGMFLYRFMQGFYRLIGTLTMRYPQVLFEGCAGGGARYDLGLMCFTPQIWTSDNTDARMRTKIQEGSLYGIPQSVMSAHVSIVPNHQTGNTTPLESRFNVAAAGILGYEYDLTKASEEELACMKKQIAFYKKHRALLQYGQYHLIDSVYDNNCDGVTSYIVVSEDKSEAIATVIQHTYEQPIPVKFHLTGLDDNFLYHISMRQQCNIDYIQDYVVRGDVLNHAPLDFAPLAWEREREQNSNAIFSRMFYIKKID